MNQDEVKRKIDNNLSFFTLTITFCNILKKSLKFMYKQTKNVYDMLKDYHS